jgi:hypothetical protein
MAYGMRGRRVRRNEDRRPRRGARTSGGSISAEHARAAASSAETENAETDYSALVLAREADTVTHQFYSPVLMKIKKIGPVFI